MSPSFRRSFLTKERTDFASAESLPAVAADERAAAGCLREGAESYVKPKSAPPRARGQEARTLLALLAQLALRADVPVEASPA